MIHWAAVRSHFSRLLGLSLRGSSSSWQWRIEAVTHWWTSTATVWGVRHRSKAIWFQFWSRQSHAGFDPLDGRKFKWIWGRVRRLILNTARQTRLPVWQLNYWTTTLRIVQGNNLGRNQVFWLIAVFVVFKEWTKSPEPAADVWLYTSPSYQPRIFI